MNLIEAIRNNIVLIAAKKTEEKLDGRQITKNIESQLEKYLGEKTSKKLMREAVSNLLMEAIEGIYEDDPQEMVTQVMVWMANYRSDNGWASTRPDAVK